MSFGQNLPKENKQVCIDSTTSLKAMKFITECDTVKQNYQDLKNVFTLEKDKFSMSKKIQNILEEERQTLESYIEELKSANSFLNTANESLLHEKVELEITNEKLQKKQRFTFFKALKYVAVFAAGTYLGTKLN